MADIEKLRKNLEDRGIRSSYFATAREAADYLDRQIDGTTVGTVSYTHLDVYKRQIQGSGRRI